jgi:membrane-bound lytic murein transglycosylase B
LCPWTACEHQPPVRLSASAALPPRWLSFLARPFGVALLLVMILLPVSGPAEVSQPPQGVWDPLTRRLISDGFDQASLTALFSRADVRFDPLIMAHKMNSLLEIKLSAGKPKSEAPELYVSYLNPFLLMRARSFLQAQRPALREAKTRFSVPEEILTALLLVETKLGRNVGTKSALSTLASMALAGDFSLVAPHIEYHDLTPELTLWLRWRTAQKAAWAYKELKALLVYAKNAGFDPASIPGSVYGAIGICQFMPTNALRYGMDLNGDGRVDLFSPSDAVLSTARFLSANGWRANLSREGQMAVLYRYNHSRPYTRTIMAIADRLREAPPEADSADW